MGCRNHVPPCPFAADYAHTAKLCFAGVLMGFGPWSAKIRESVGRPTTKINPPYSCALARRQCVKADHLASMTIDAIAVAEAFQSTQ